MVLSYAGELVLSSVVEVTPSSVVVFAVGVEVDWVVVVVVDGGSSVVVVRRSGVVVLVGSSVVVVVVVVVVDGAAVDVG